MFQQEHLNIDIDKENSRPSTAGMSPESHEVEISCLSVVGCVVCCVCCAMCCVVCYVV